jgi:hypothetical protein
MHDERVSEEMRTFLLSAIAMSVAAWNVAFFLGVFDTIFFDKVFAVWVAATTVFLGSFFIPDERLSLPFGWGGRVILALPTVWLLAALIDDRNIEQAFTDGLVLWSSIATGLVSLPYLLYVGVILVTPGDRGLSSPRLLAALATIVVVIGALGFVIGRYNHVFLTCWDFRVSGNDVPHRCRAGPKAGQVSPARAAAAS